MQDRRVLSFTTDYGLSDGFVAACHGVAVQVAPDLRLIDVTHDIPPGDVKRGAVVLAQTVPYLPYGVHVAVVDPKVGTARRPVAVQARDGLLVGPDNGLLPWAATALGGAQHAVMLTNSRLHRHPVSHTFHGRDIFTPVAAALAAGTPLSEAGEGVRIDQLHTLPEPLIEVGDDRLRAEIASVDRFGNLQLAAAGHTLDCFGEELHVAGRKAVRGDMFAAADPGAVVVLVDSSGHVAIAVNDGSAAALLGLHSGDVVTVTPAGDKQGGA